MSQKLEFTTVKSGRFGKKQTAGSIYVNMFKTSAANNTQFAAEQKDGKVLINITLPDGTIWSGGTEELAAMVKDSLKPKATIQEIKLRRLPDSDPDLSWLDQFENSTDPQEKEYYKRDQERKEAYGHSWGMIGIRATAIIHIPLGQGNSLVEEIESGGLWGIEDDSKESYLQEVEKEQIEDLRANLSTLNVDLSNFDELVADLYG